MQLDVDQQRIVQVVYDVFRADGEWPIVGAVDRVADERWEIDAHAVLKRLSSDIALVDQLQLRDDHPVKLRVRGIMACESSGADLRLFVRAVRWLAEKERSFRPTSMHAAEEIRVTSEQFAADVASEGIAVDSVASAKVSALAEVERLTWGGTFRIDGDPGRWEINLRRDIRPFRRVETLDDYLAIRDRLDGAAAEVQPVAWDSSAAASRGVSASIDNRRCAFIAMPFRAAWSDALHACIESACASVNAHGLPLRWQRADKIERPGRITEQILDALAAADVVIADITGLNANVVYELGYADASRTPLIILSQDPAASPFDLKDLRQIRYSTDDLDAVRQPLTAYLRAALGTNDDRP